MILNPATEIPLHDLDLPLEEYEEESAEVIVSPVDTILEKAGLLTPAASNLPSGSQASEVSQALNRHNASMEDVAESMSNIMRDGENDNVKLKAAETISKLHGHLKPSDRGDPISPAVNLTVISEGKASNLMQLLVPTAG